MGIQMEGQVPANKHPVYPHRTNRNVLCFFLFQRM